MGKKEIQLCGINEVLLVYLYNFSTVCILIPILSVVSQTRESSLFLRLSQRLLLFSPLFYVSSLIFIQSTEARESNVPNILLTHQQLVNSHWFSPPIMSWQPSYHHSSSPRLWVGGTWHIRGLLRLWLQSKNNIGSTWLFSPYVSVCLQSCQWLTWPIRLRGNSLSWY